MISSFLNLQSLLLPFSSTFLQRNGVFFISGDVHFGEISRYDCGAKYPLYDITSSGLTQAVEKAVPPAFRSLIRGIAWLTPSTMRLMGSTCRYSSCAYGSFPFIIGLYHFVWTSSCFFLPLRCKSCIRQTEFWSNWDKLEWDPSQIEIWSEGCGGISRGSCKYLSIRIARRQRETGSCFKWRISQTLFFGSESPMDCQISPDHIILLLLKRCVIYISCIFVSLHIYRYPTIGNNVHPMRYTWSKYYRCRWNQKSSALNTGTPRNEKLSRRD